MLHLPFRPCGLAALPHVVLGLLACLPGPLRAAGAPAATAVSALPAAHRPVGVDGAFRVTPAGLFHPDCVHALPAGARLGADGAVRHADGRLETLVPCPHPRLDASGQALPPRLPDERPLYDGWIAASHSDWRLTPPAQRLDADMRVPAPPGAQVGQVLYYFPGLEDGQSPNKTILQPVLAWNGFNDRRWSVTNWHCCRLGHIWHGSTIAAAPGQRIRTRTAGSACSGGVCQDWTLDSRNLDSGGRTVFHTEGYGQVFDWYFGGAKEAYGVSACVHLPADGRIDFTSIRVWDTLGEQSTPRDWEESVYTRTPACAYQVDSRRHRTRISWQVNR